MRRIGEADLPLILAWSNSGKACGPYLTPQRLTAAALREQFDGNALWRTNDRTFLIETRQTGLPIGTIHYWLRRNQRAAAVVSVKVAEPDQRGQGFGTEAQKFLIMHLFDQVGVQTVSMYTDINNAAQQRCLKKLGFSIVDAVSYDDCQVVRTGFLFQLAENDYRRAAIYHFHYE